MTYERFATPCLLTTGVTGFIGRAVFKLAVLCGLAVKGAPGICGQLPSFVESFVVNLSPPNRIKFQA